jgi:uncharacterized phage-associated protein
VSVTRITGGPQLRFAYDEAKSGELAACFVQLAGTSVPMLKLLKLMYLADRTSLVESGFTITGDAMVAMDKGPVLSLSYNGLKPQSARPLPFVTNTGEVHLASSPPEDGRLSDYEIGVARRIWAKFGRMTGQQLIAYLHREAPEWKAPPHGSSTTIDPADILRAAGKSEEEIAAVAAEAEYFVSLEQRRSS